MGNIIVNAAVCSDIGTKRDKNEDNFFLCGQRGYSSDITGHTVKSLESADQGVFAVFDGMGGQSLGDEASAYATVILDRYAQDIIRHGEPAVGRYVYELNSRICENMSKRGLRIGTTMVILAFSDDKAAAYNIGDSRAYLCRGNCIYLLSEDHTVVSQLVSMGMLTPDEARNDKRRHQLTQHLGIFPEEMVVQAFTGGEFELVDGDCLLLCSDGVTDALSDGEILDYLTAQGDSASLAEELVETAIRNGSRDNVTAMVIKAMAIRTANSPPPPAQNTNKEVTSGIWRSLFGINVQKWIYMALASAALGAIIRILISPLFM